MPQPYLSFIHYHLSFPLRLAQQLTHLVGEVSGIIAVHDTIIDDREAKLMPIRRLAIASERDDARQRAGLRLHVAMGITRFHALLQRAIDTSDRQGLLQLLIHILVTIGIAKELHLQFGTQIVVKRKSRTISQLIA